MAESRDQLLQRYIDAYPGMKNRHLARKIVEDGELPSDTNIESLRQTIGKIRKGVTVQLVDETKYHVSNNQYIWKTQRGEINLSVDFIDQLFFEYSMHGENLSQTQIINKHNLAPWQWGSIKTTLMLYKHANIFSPHTVEQTPPEKLQEMIASKVKQVFENVGYQVEQIYDKTLKAEYKKVIKKQAGKELFYETILTELQDLFAGQAGPVPTPQIRIQKDSSGALTVTIFDVHFGAKTKDTDFVPYSPEIVEAMFDKIANAINEQNAEEVHLLFGGDNIESLTGLNHIDSWKGLASGYYGSRAVIECYKMYVKFISKVNNVKSVYAVPGNHDRASADNKIDTDGYIAAIIFEMVRLAFNNQIPVVYHDKMISVEIDHIQYLMSHGHFKFSNAPASELILDYGNPDLYNVLISGHWHTRKMQKEHRRFRQFVSPSLVPGNNYSNDLGVSATPGFLMMKNNGHGKPIVIDYSL